MRRILFDMASLQPFVLPLLGSPETGARHVGKANRRLRKPSSYTRLVSRVPVYDIAWGGLSPLLAFFLRDGTIYSPGVVAAYCAAALLASLFVFQWFQTGSPIARFYSARDAVELLKACALVAALSAVTLFLISRLEDAPRAIPILHFLLLGAGLLAIRAAMVRHEIRRDRPSPQLSKTARHVLIIQASRPAWFFCKMVEELAPGDFQIVAILDERQAMRHRSLHGYPIIGTPAELDKVLADYAMHGVRIDQIVVAARPEELSGATWGEISWICRARQIELEVLAERLMPGLPVRAAAASSPAPSAALMDDEIRALLDRPLWTVKRVIDFAIALGVLILTLPLTLIVCALVLLDVGFPIVFWQQRLGRNGAPLYLYKFRTLHAPFDRRTKQRRNAQEPSPIGRFLRSSRLDELPQIWNVLSGDMSLVGPRPLLAADQPPDATLRLSVRPGLTGWAQICGGKLVSAEEKNALDEWYIRHASLALDAVIVLRTIRMLLTSDRRAEQAIATALLERSVTARPATVPTAPLACAAANSAEIATAREPIVPAASDAVAPP
jgi:lipopolysaccharide/colanic/teichoic acid biosynthesis glycosyltransferase